LTDEDGKELELEHLDTLEIGDVTYMAFIPADTPEDAESADMIILKVAREDDEEILVTVDDELELENVYNMFMERIDEPGELEN